MLRESIRQKRKLNGGEAVLEALEAEGVKVIYGLPGISTLKIYDALYSKKEITHITVKYEANAAIMADAQGRLTGEPGICLTIAGPGATNTVTAIAEAYDAASPVLHISGAELGDGRYGYFHGMDDPDFLRKIFEPVTKWSHRIEKVEDIPRDLSRAFKVARSGRKGPVHIEIPLGVLEAIDLIDPYESQLVPRRDPPEEVVKELVSLLLKAEMPVIYAGQGVLRDSASDELGKLSELLGAPVITTFYESNVIPHDHPFFAGIVGCRFSREYLEYEASSPAVANLLEEADVLFSVGIRLGTPESELLKEIGSKQIIHLDVEENKFAHEFPIQIEVVSSIKSTLQRLLAALKGKTLKRKRDVKEEIAEFRRRVKSNLRRIVEEKEKAKPIHPAVAVDKLRKALERDAIVISDIGMCQAWLSDFFEVYTPNSYLDPGSYGSMGFALPAAIAAKVLFPEREVVAVAGDGGFFMSLQEFQTAVENELNIVVIVFNDSKYNSLWHIQKSQYNGRFIAVDMYPANFAKYAETYEVKGIRVEEPSALKQAYEEALSSKTPTIIDVVIDNKYYPIERRAFIKHKRKHIPS